MTVETAKRQTEETKVDETDDVLTLDDLEDFHGIVKRIQKSIKEPKKVLEYASGRIRVFSHFKEGNSYLQLFDIESEDPNPASMCFFKETRLLNTFLMNLIGKWEKSSGNSANIKGNHF